MTDVDPLALAGWRAQVGDLPSEDLPRLATEALERGLDSPSLSELAGQNPRDVRDSRDLFIRALEELNLPAPDPTTAIRLLVRSTAAQIVAGDISPQNGARWLWQASDRVEDEGDLRVFIGLSSYADDHPEDIRTIDDQIVAAATELLERPELRRWVKLMASVEGSPTTRHHGITQETVEVSPEDLPLSGQLIAELRSWNAFFVRTMEGWPRVGGFDSEAEADTFVDRGNELSRNLQAELGPAHYVEYMPEPRRPPGMKLARGFRARARSTVRRLTSNT